MKPQRKSNNGSDKSDHESRIPRYIGIAGAVCLIILEWLRLHGWFRRF